MIGRMSTPGQHAAAIAQILRQQVALARTQVQVASGRRVQTPADDPIAATRILAAEKSQSQLGQYERNANLAAQRLAIGESALADLGTLLQRVYELTLQANSGTMDVGSLRAVATEIESRAGELLQIANRQDGNGEYLYAGFSSQTRPFASNGAGVTYAGDQGVRQLQISATQKLADGFSGESVFVDVPEVNGLFAANLGVHTGTGVLGETQVTDPAAWAAAAAAAAAIPQPHAYTIRFSDPDANGSADTWEVLDAGGATVTTGTYTDGAAIGFNGVQITVRGVPATGDTITIAPAGTKSVFSTLQDLVTALGVGADSPESRARLGSELNAAIAQLTTSMDHVNDLRAQTGARLSALDAAAAQREDLDYHLAESLGAMRDVDYAAAISRLNQQAAGLQAAQAAYTRIGQMSLFEYL